MPTSTHRRPARDEGRQAAMQRLQAQRAKRMASSQPSQPAEHQPVASQLPPRSHNARQGASAGRGSARRFVDVEAGGGASSDRELDGAPDRCMLSHFVLCWRHLAADDGDSRSVCMSAACAERDVSHGAGLVTTPWWVHQESWQGESKW